MRWITLLPNQNLVKLNFGIAIENNEDLMRFILLLLLRQMLANLHFFHMFWDEKSF